jgi:hypothetical protein
MKNEFSVFGLFRGLRDRKNGNECATFKSLMELDGAFGRCKDCVIFTLADAFTWPPFVTALTHDDVAWVDSLTAKDFYA